MPDFLSSMSCNMPVSKDEYNPLRPYYRPPTIGELSDPVPAPSPNPFSSGGNVTTNSAKYASSAARNVLGDIDYKEYLGDESPSIFGNAKELVDELVWKYVSVLMGQPFEVAKMVLQARDQDEKAAFLLSGEPETPKRQMSNLGISYGDQDSDSEGEEPAYFTSNAPGTPSPLYSRSANGRRVESPTEAPLQTKKQVLPEHYLNLTRSNSVLEVIGQLWQKDGTWGVFKGANATFLYTVLQSLLENWSRSFLSAIFNVPDLGVKEDLDRLLDIASPYPWASFFIAGAAAVATGVALAPLDLVRTWLILTPSFKGQRRTILTLRALPSYVCSSIVALPTILHSLVNPIFTLSLPLVLKTKFMITSEASPIAFSFAKFLASSTGIMIKLPLETVLRRGQLSVLSQPEYTQALCEADEKMETIIPPGRYYGVFGTMYHIITEEGNREIPAKPATTKRNKAKGKSQQPTYKKGQGLDGLLRGWKVGWWGLVGLWAATTVGHGGEGEF